MGLAAGVACRPRGRSGGEGRESAERVEADGGERRRGAPVEAGGLVATRSERREDEGVRGPLRLALSANPLIWPIQECLIRLWT